jgi:hypothetical protein
MAFTVGDAAVVTASANESGLPSTSCCDESAFVWARTKQPIREQEMASALFANFYATTREQAPEDVKEILKHLRELGLLLD